MNCKLRHLQYSFSMATTVLLPTRTNVHTHKTSHSHLTTTHRSGKPTQYYEYYVPTIASTQRSRQYLTTGYHRPTQRGTYYYETSDIFADPNYYYYHSDVDNTIQWF